MKNGTLKLERLREFAALTGPARVGLVLSAWAETEAELLQSGRGAFGHPADSIGDYTDDLFWRMFGRPAWPETLAAQPFRMWTGGRPRELLIAAGCSLGVAEAKILNAARSTLKGVIEVETEGRRFMCLISAPRFGHGVEQNTNLPDGLIPIFGEAAVLARVLRSTHYAAIGLDLARNERLWDWTSRSFQGGLQVDAAMSAVIGTNGACFFFGAHAEAAVPPPHIAVATTNNPT
jgi:hypothetical protein